MTHSHPPERNVRKQSAWFRVAPMLVALVGTLAFALPSARAQQDREHEPLEGSRETLGCHRTDGFSAKLSSQFVGLKWAQ